MDVVRKYSNHTSLTPDAIINQNLKSHSNFNMLRYYVQTMMAEIRSVQAGLDAPDTMWELMIKEDELYIVYMGNPHMYRLMAERMYLNIEEDTETKRLAELHGILVI